MQVLTRIFYSTKNPLHNYNAGVRPKRSVSPYVELKIGKRRS